MDGTKILREVWGDNALVPLYDNEDSVCGIIYNDEPYYFQKNLQGDIIGIVDKNAQTVARYSYDAWGVCTVTQDTSECGIAAVNPFRYRGYFYDEEIGMYYLQSRYYDPGVGRFINSDTSDSLQEINNVLENNLFTYCQNNSTNETDYSGCLIGTIVKSVLIGVFKGIVFQLISDLVSYLYKAVFININTKLNLSDTKTYLQSIAECVFDELLGFLKKHEIAIQVACIVGRFVGKFLKNKKIERSDIYILCTELISLYARKQLDKIINKNRQSDLKKLKKYRKTHSKNLKLKTSKQSLNLFYTKKGVAVNVTLDISGQIINALWEMLPA